ncbi:MAG: hypothetical protein V4555_16425, partial [Acidobacteriota bacterium]
DARKLAATAAGAPWSENVLRRSFASYHLEFYQDGAKTASVIGHTDAGTTFAKYRIPTTKAAAKEWFALTPAKVRKLMR